MTLSRLTIQLGLSFSTLFLMTTSIQAGIPLWSFSPIGNPDVTLDATGTATVQYTVTNNSRKFHQLTLSAKTPKGISQAGPCTLNPRGTCTLTLNINGSALPSDNISGGPILCQATANNTPNPNQCYEPSSGNTLVITRTATPETTTLSVTPSTLGLSVNNPSSNAVLTGQARHFTIQNTGTNTATGLTLTYPTWPGGTPATIAASTCTDTLLPGATCTITITPGSNATSNCNTGLAPAAVDTAVTISATNIVAPITANAAILSYGCIYQGGFIYAVDDTTPSTGSIGGKVASLVDQAAPFAAGAGGAQPTSIIWSSNGSGGALADLSVDIIPLIAETSTPADSYFQAQTTFNTTYSNIATFPFPASSAFATCNGPSDGHCNSGNILAFYNTYNTGYGVGTSPYVLSAGPTNPAYYAAGVCTVPISSYSDWYLPALCEMDAVSGSITCPTGTQSMVINLSFLIGNPSTGTPSTSCNPSTIGTTCLAGTYWSSTEYTADTQNDAWVEFFNSGGSLQDFSGKGSQVGVRCSRALTP